MKKKGELTDRTNQAAFEAVCEIPLQTNIGRLKSLGNIAYSQDLRRSGGNVVARSANEIPSWVEAAAEILTYWKANREVHFCLLQDDANIPPKGHQGKVGRNLGSPSPFWTRKVLL